jgi:4-hydroxy-3-methylbut-2-enyl diphosphate reductase
MEITIGKTAGFCYGVKRAVEGASEITETEKGELYGLGEIVHNKEVVEKLSNKGIKFVDSLEKARDNIIIRAHGVPQNIYKEAKNRKINVIDFTCPNVLKVHDIAKEYHKKVYFVVLFGKKEHPENIGTTSYCENDYYIIENEDEIENAVEAVKNSKKNKVLIIFQTTYSKQKFIEYSHSIEEKLKNEGNEVVIKNTICNATEVRQKETEELSKNQEYMIIIGGKNSSNTKELYKIASKYCKNTISIETEKELNLEEIKKYNKIGIMAGASTPQECIKRVQKYLGGI